MFPLWLFLDHAQVDCRLSLSEYRLLSRLNQVEAVLRPYAPLQAVHLDVDWTCTMDDTPLSETKQICFLEYAKKEVSRVHACPPPPLTHALRCNVYACAIIDRWLLDLLVC
jgi:hypothetical protein